MMRFLRLTCLIALLGTTVACFGQAPYYPHAELGPPKFDVAIGYNYIGANAPPASCQCFNMQGGFVSANYQLTPWLGITGKVTGDHAGDISVLGQDLTLMTFLGGPKISLPYRRFTPYGVVLVGGARASNSYFPSGQSSATSATTFAFSAGGGVDFHLTHRFAIRLADVEYLRTTFPNGAGNTQNQLEASAGLVIRFGSWSKRYHNTVSAPPKLADAVALACSVNAATVNAGDLVQVVANAVTLPANQTVTYTWTSTGGTLDQQGHFLTINTTGLSPGSYEVTGHAVLVSSPTTSSDCDASFQVKEAAAPTATPNAAPAAPEGSNVSDDDFQSHVKDAFFDYDSYELRPDAQQALSADAAYLNANPGIQITIGGYADERGSEEFNLALGLNRANAARTALVNAGVDTSRIQVISYGKEKPFCTETTDSCYQLNRRAQIVLRR
jgi:peptidoglycan-associated lipoprotein